MKCSKTVIFMQQNSGHFFANLKLCKTVIFMLGKTDEILFKAVTNCWLFLDFNWRFLLIFMPILTQNVYVCDFVYLSVRVETAEIISY